MTTETVRSMFNGATQAADAAAEHLKAAYVELHIIDGQTKELAHKLASTFNLGPSERIRIARAILALQLERESVVLQTMDVVEHRPRE